MLIRVEKFNNKPFFFPFPKESMVMMQGWKYSIIEIHPSLLVLWSPCNALKAILLQLFAHLLSPRHGVGAIPKDQPITEEVSLACFCCGLLFHLLRTHTSSTRLRSQLCLMHSLHHSPGYAFKSFPTALRFGDHTAPDSALTISSSKPVRNGPLGILNKAQANTTERWHQNPTDAANNATKWVSWSGNLPDMNAVHTHSFWVGAFPTSPSLLCKGRTLFVLWKSELGSSCGFLCFSGFLERDLLGLFLWW